VSWSEKNGLCWNSATPACAPIVACSTFVHQYCQQLLRLTFFFACVSPPWPHFPLFLNFRRWNSQQTFSHGLDHQHVLPFDITRVAI
jgi:hypothetical protein